MICRHGRDTGKLKQRDTEMINFSLRAGRFKSSRLGCHVLTTLERSERGASFVDAIRWCGCRELGWLWIRCNARHEPGAVVNGQVLSLPKGAAMTTNIMCSIIMVIASRIIMPPIRLNSLGRWHGMIFDGWKKEHHAKTPRREGRRGKKVLWVAWPSRSPERSRMDEAWP